MSDNFDIQIENSYSDLDSLNSSLNIENLLILHLNVRSINSNFEKLEIFIENLTIKPDVIVCTETWALMCYSFFSLNNYDIYYNHSHINRADGVIMYVKKSLQYTPMTEVVGDLKIVSVKIKLNNNKSIKVSGVYRCHDVNKESFVNLLSTYLSDKHGKNHVIAGDFNFNLQSVEQITNLFMSTFLDNGYLPYFNGTTRPHDLGGSCIDNIFIKTNFSDIKSFTYTNVFTDHYPILCL